MDNQGRWKRPSGEGKQTGASEFISLFHSRKTLHSKPKPPLMRRRGMSSPSWLWLCFIVVACSDYSLMMQVDGKETVFENMLDWIIDAAVDFDLTVYPGTHYCGLQSEKENRDPESDIDQCCYYHDQCSKYAIMANQEKYHIVNPHSYPIHPCECNQNFTQCLHDIDSVNAGVVANLYYDLVEYCIEKDQNGTYCCLVPQKQPE